MSSPALSSTSTARPPAPGRNKSSSNLSSHGSTTNFRAKRNKSSSSLHAGHHSVQFAHHGKKAGKRSGSIGAGTKGRVDFGFTSMKSEEAAVASGEDSPREEEAEAEEEREEEERRKSAASSGRRKSSTSSAVAALRERGRRDEEERVRGRERQEAEQVIDDEQEERERAKARSRSRSKGPPARERSKPPSKVVSSVASSAASEWENTADSPLGIGRTLPASTIVEGISGLGQVIGAGDAIVHQQEETAAEDPVTPSKTGKGKGRATFQMGGTEPSPPVATSPSPLPPPPPPPAAPVDRLPSNAATRPPATYDQPPSTTSRPPSTTSSTALTWGATTPPQEPAAPRVDLHPSSPSPPITRNSSPPAARNNQGSTRPSTSAVPFPSYPNPSKSPVRAYPSVRGGPQGNGTKRKPSNASIISTSSARSFAGSTFGNLMGPGALRRSASSIAMPTVGIDRGTVAVGEVIFPDGQRGPAGGKPPERMHQRTESMGSMRSLRTVSEAAAAAGGPRRSVTMGLDAGREVAQRLRAAAQPPSSASSGALAAFGNLGVPSRPSTNPPSPGGLTSKRSIAAGYLSTLRGLTSLPGFASPATSPSPSTTRPTSRASYPIPGSANGNSGASTKGKSRANTPRGSFIVSKFFEPPPSESLLSASPRALHGGAGFGGRTANNSSANLGAMTRTQQKAILARDAPYWPDEGGLGLVEYGRGGAGRMNGSGRGDGKGDAGMRPTLGLVKEVERIERQYQAVVKWRDPLGESLERVLQPLNGDGKKVAKTRA